MLAGRGGISQHEGGRGRRDQEFKASLGGRARLCLQKPKSKTNKREMYILLFRDSKNITHNLTSQEDPLAHILGCFFPKLYISLICIPQTKL
jgi:hypothetical protein